MTSPDCRRERRQRQPVGVPKNELRERRRAAPRRRQQEVQRDRARAGIEDALQIDAELVGSLRQRRRVRLQSSHRRAAAARCPGQVRAAPPVRSVYPRSAAPRREAAATATAPSAASARVAIANGRAETARDLGPPPEPLLCRQARLADQRDRAASAVAGRAVGCLAKTASSAASTSAGIAALRLDGRRRRGVTNLLQNLGRRAVERPMASQDLVHQHAKRIDVGRGSRAGCRSKSSGAIYAGVPIGSNAGTRLGRGSTVRNCARPKSRILGRGWPSGPSTSKTLPGFKSRCSTPCSWA